MPVVALSCTHGDAELRPWWRSDGEAGTVRTV